jgi:hypothetical protein
MANRSSDEKNLVHLNAPDKEANSTPNTDPSSLIQLGANSQLDLSGLTTEQQQQLMIKHAEAKIDVDKRTQELVADAGALNHSLGTMAHHTEGVAAAGQDVTITHTQENSLGRTEIIMGTSDAAKKGKLTRSQTGETDHTLLYAGIAVFAIIVIALLNR